MKIIIFILPFILSFQCFGFDTSSGTYISEQDLIRSIRHVFFDLNDNSNPYEHRRCVEYDSNNRVNLDELGFANLETGQRMVYEPDASYVLFLDSCISKITTHLFSDYASGAFLDRIIGQTLIDELVASYSGKVAKYKISDGTFLVTNLKDAKINPIPSVLREKIIDEIFLRVIVSVSLVPVEYLNISKQQLLALPENTSLDFFVAEIIKKAMINDYFLTY